MRKTSIILAASLAANPAFAHLNPDHHGSFAAGLSHPVFGADHILAMVAVGLWAASMGGRATWMLPSAFICAMIVGFYAAIAGFQLPFVEPMILASVLALGLAIAFAFQVRAAAAAVIVGFFGIYHGVAHGGELGSAGMFAFGLGFAVSTALLHALGVCLAVTALRAQLGAKALRGLGLATTLGGLLIAVGG